MFKVYVTYKVENETCEYELDDFVKYECLNEGDIVKDSNGNDITDIIEELIETYENSEYMEFMELLECLKGVNLRQYSEPVESDGDEYWRHSTYYQAELWAEYNGKTIACFYYDFTMDRDGDIESFERDGNLEF